MRVYIRTVLIMKLEYKTSPHQKKKSSFTEPKFPAPKLNVTHQLLVYADDVNILDGSVHTVKKHTETSVVASYETGLEVNADITKHMVMS